MTFVRANPPGWALFELLLSGQMNTIDSQMPFALDGGAGGAYTPTDGIDLQGSAVAAGLGVTLQVSSSAVPGPALQVIADEVAVAAGINVSIAAITTGVFSGGADLDDAGALGVSVGGFGLNNVTGDGGVGGNFSGGDGGTAGDGVAGIVAQGGDATTASQAGGPGVDATGGEPLGGGSSDAGASAGLLATGGSTSGSDEAGHGIVGIGGISTGGLDGHGGLFQGQGTRSGIVATGGSGGGIGGIFLGNNSQPGLRALGGAIPEAIRCDGSIDFNLASAANKNPASTVAVLNKLYGKSLIKAWGFVVDGAIVDGFNVTSIGAGSATNRVLVTMAQAMASADYCVLVSPTNIFGGAPRIYSKEDQSSVNGPTTTTFEIGQWTLAGATANMTTSEFGFAVIGVQ